MKGYHTAWHESMSQGRGRVKHGRDRVRQDRGTTEALHDRGKKREAGLYRGCTEARGWAGHRPEAGLDKGQRLGWTEAEQRLDTGRAGPKTQRLCCGKKQRPGCGKK
jgi:hypothetical protein